MLNDAEHKLFTLLVKDYDESGSSPTWNSLQSYSNWTKEELIGLINSLERKGYLQWNSQNVLTIHRLRLPSPAKTKKIKRND